MKIVDDCKLKNKYKYCKYAKILNNIKEFNSFIESNKKEYILVTMSSVLSDIGIFDDHDKESAYHGIRYHLFHAGIFVTRENQKEDNILVLKLRKRNEKDTLPEFLAKLQIPPALANVHGIQPDKPISISSDVKTVKSVNTEQTKSVSFSDDINRMLDETAFPPIWNPLPGEFIHGPVIHVFHDPKGNEGRGRTNITIDTRNNFTGKLGIWGSEVIYKKLEVYYGIKRTELVENLTGKFLTIRYNGEKLSNSSGFIYKDYDLLLLDNENEMINKSLYF